MNHDVLWRDTALSPKIFILDARAVFPLPVPPMNAFQRGGCKARLCGWWWSANGPSGTLWP